MGAIDCMRTSIILVDDFYSNPFLVREYAIRQHYYFPYDVTSDVVEGKKDFHWKTSWFKNASECPFKSSQELIERLENLTGDKIDRDHWNTDFPIAEDGKGIPGNIFPNQYSCLWNCSFHLKNQFHQELGNGVHNHVTDNWNSVGIDGWAGIIYLNPRAPIYTGLNLWRNIDTRKNFDWMSSKENWIHVDMLGSIFNRLILCRGDIPHSGVDGWGSDIETGRLFQTFFFKVVPKKNDNNLSIKMNL